VLAGTFSGDGSGLTNLNVAQLNGSSGANFWQLGGNEVTNGQFLGSTNFQPVELWVNNARALRVEPTTNTVDFANCVNLVGGSPFNYIAPGSYGSVIVGGGGKTDDALYVGYNMSNNIYAHFSFIGGGQDNWILSGADFSFVGGGGSASIGAGSLYSVLVGGSLNRLTSEYAFIGGGDQNTISGGSDNSFLGCGYQNQITGGWALNSVLVGGSANIVEGADDFLGGGNGNVCGGNYSVVPGGVNNSASGTGSFAAGCNAKAKFQGDFVWADSQTADFGSSSKDQFLIRSQGGIGVDTTNTPEGSLSINTNVFLFANTLYLRGDHGADYNHGLAYCGHTYNNFDASVMPDGPVLWGYTGGALAVCTNGHHAVLSWSDGNVAIAGALTVNGNITCTSLNQTSDRNAKENFESLDPQTMLAKVAAMPVTEWNYRGESAAQKHVGPMAQDFQAAFGLNGGDDKHISVVDEGGVALAAIQGLNEKVNEKEAKIQGQAAEIADLKAQLAELKQVVQSLVKQ